MTLPITVKSAPPAYPLLARLAGLLWSLPAPAQLSGDSSSGDVIVVSNHAPLVRYLLAHQIELNVLALDSGGLMPAASAAFGHAREDKVIAALRQQALLPGAQLLVPISMAAAMRWHDGQRIEDWEVFCIPDDPAGMLKCIQEKDPQALRPPLPAVVRRLLYGLGLCLGQMLIFAVPLWLFSLPTLAIGLAGMLFSSLLLALIWSVSSCCGGAKGLLAGLMLVGLTALGVMLFTEGLAWSGLLLPLLGLCLLSFWMGMIFNGAK